MQENSKKKFSKTVYLLSFVSLFADISSELLYPILPIYLKTIGMDVGIIGSLEGFANFVAGLSRGFFGRWSDLIGKRMPFVWVGYIASMLGKGLIGIISSPWWVLICRTSDRLGKGIRTGARDAILAEEAGAKNRGAVFGFHRAMDTTGAFIGPALGLIILWFYPGEYKKIFLLSLLPIVIIVPLLKLVPEKAKPVREGKIFSRSLSYWKKSTTEYKKIIIVTALFTLLNSSDVYLLIKAKQIVESDLMVVSFYILYNFVYAGTSYFFGRKSDVLGRMFMFKLGLVFFGVSYLIIGYASSLDQLIAGFAIYGLFSGATEGVIKAWVSEYADSADYGLALGFQGTILSVCTLIASVVAGFIWHAYGDQYVFLFSGFGAIFLLLVLAIYRRHFSKGEFKH